MSLENSTALCRAHGPRVERRDPLPEIQGNFTYAREPSVERLLMSLCQDVRDIVSELAPGERCRALFLIGGYGRGEGGVEITPNGPQPHNNLDFLLVTNGLSNEETVQLVSEIDAALDSVRSAYGIGIDISGITSRKLRHSPCLVMWYDMRYGHKLLMGDEDLLPSLSRFQVDEIPAWNVRDLLVNRGTLLVLNQWIHRQLSRHGKRPEHLQARRIPKELDRIAIRHLIKAVIGYGDALLYFAGEYHWSYAEKLQRMQHCSLADPDFIQLYSDASTFRFVADYDSIGGRSVRQWQEQVMPLLSHVHLACESLHLQRRLDTWSDYPRLAGIGALWEQWQSPRAWLRKAAYVARDRQVAMPGNSVLTRLGLRAAGQRSRLSLAFPGVAYQLPELEPWSRQLLDCDDDDNLLDAYVALWGKVGDTNFRNFLAKVSGLIAKPRSQSTSSHSTTKEGVE